METKSGWDRPTLPASERNPQAMETDRCILRIKAVPQAACTAIVGWLDDALKIRLHAPPVNSLANEELCRFLADVLGVPRHSVQLVSGGAAREKRVQVTGLTKAAVEARISQVQNR
jgi:uncharacterized protein